MLRNFFVNLDNKKAYILALFCAVVILMIVFAEESNSRKSKDKTVKINNTKPPAVEVVDKTEEPTPTPTPLPTEEVEVIPEGKVASRLTGLWIDEKLANKRPYALMFNNIKVASPQSGTSDCDILLEAGVEGGITRLMGISQKFTSDKIGSLRSARPYYVGFCKDFDALYIHMGGSKDAKSLIKTLGVPNMDGTTGIGNILTYRDTSRKAPHNTFTSAKRIDNAVASKGYRTDFQGKADNHFTFNKGAIEPEEGKGAGKVSIKFSSYTTPYFTYDSSTKLYGRYQFGTAHKDNNTGKQLTFTNIIIMYVKQWSLDSADRQAMDINNSSGVGYYISNGKAVDIKWTRNQSQGKMQFLDSSGNLLSVNKGKTYIAVVSNSFKSATSISAN